MENLKRYFVEDFEKAVESTDRSNRLLGLMQAYDKQLGVGSFTVAKGADSEYKVFGYYEETYDLDGNLISRGGGILFEIEWSYKHTTQFWAGPIPLYLDIVAEKDISQGNDSAEVIFALPDLAVEAESFRTDSGYVVAVTARNLSSIPTDATIRVVADSLSDGLVLDMKNIGTLDKNEDFVYLYAIDRDSIDFSGARSAIM